MLETRDIFRINLQKKMQERGVSQTDLAEAVNVSTSTASDWCKGKKYPRPNKMQMIADYLHVSMSWLMTGEPPRILYSFEDSTDSSELGKLVKDFTMLDAHGKSVVLTVLQLEMERMSGKNEEKG